jgi:hypothetical protein
MSICFWTFDAKSQSAYESKSIYEAGEALTSCEVNFKNLFNNWNSGNVTNADSLHLMNFAFVETISDASSIDMYVRLLIDNKSIVASRRVESGSGSDIKPYRRQFISISTFGSMMDHADTTKYTPTEILRLFELEKENLRNMIRPNFSVGDKVYAVFFKDNRQVYTNFVICNPKTNKVVWDAVFSGLTVETDL